ncbi:hypothetical protein HHK36_021230 [Tetracentron sinense]|uniref:CCHC-type domain-containing protein n=1 Tax=Tetracentron sinense TaxID=13715 RepID=A0A835DAG3_TETSI|nr:hypothetical protein HHK36_021230 [Tetracentron sinense]
MNIGRPLRYQIKLSRPNKEPTIIEIRYERLPVYCYHCGIIGHDEKNCSIPGMTRKPTWSIESNTYGPWLRADYMGPIKESFTKLSQQASGQLIIIGRPEGSSSATARKTKDTEDSEIETVGVRIVHPAILVGQSSLQRKNSNTHKGILSCPQISDVANTSESRSRKEIFPDSSKSNQIPRPGTQKDQLGKRNEGSDRVDSMDIQPDPPDSKQPGVVLPELMQPDPTGRGDKRRLELGLITCLAANGRNLDRATEDTTIKTSEKQEQTPIGETPQEQSPNGETPQDAATSAVLSERRKALFEPLEPTMNVNGKRPSAEVLLPPPDFDSASYPRGWLIGKKRKLVNVDVVESMRRIAVQEMNRKDREIDGLNEQLEEDARCLEHLQLQLLQERSKRTDVERENTMLQNQISMLMNMLQENEGMEEEGTEES